MSEPKAPGSGPKTQSAPRFKRPSLKLLICGLVALVVLIVGIPRILRSLNTVSTDDAYVIATSPLLRRAFQARSCRC